MLMDCWYLSLYENFHCKTPLFSSVRVAPGDVSLSMGCLQITQCSATSISQWQIKRTTWSEHMAIRSEANHDVTMMQIYMLRL